jgi:hypothetical protein
MKKVEGQTLKPASDLQYRRKKSFERWGFLCLGEDLLLKTGVLGLFIYEGN